MYFSKKQFEFGRSNFSTLESVNFPLQKAGKCDVNTFIEVRMVSNMGV